eukprot:4789297-Pyramimonas_sp.AAC.1
MAGRRADDFFVAGLRESAGRLLVGNVGELRRSGAGWLCSACDEGAFLSARVCNVEGGHSIEG